MSWKKKKKRKKKDPLARFPAEAPAAGPGGPSAALRGRKPCLGLSAGTGWKILGGGIGGCARLARLLAIGDELTSRFRARARNPETRDARRSRASNAARRGGKPLGSHHDLDGLLHDNIYIYIYV